MKAMQTMKLSDTLDVVAKGDREILIKREFEAPAKLVFRALTEPALVKRWMLGPGDFDMPVCDIDLRVGGAYKQLWKNRKDGSEMVLFGTFREIVADKRIVRTERFEAGGWSTGESVGTVVLTERGGRTLVETTVLYESAQMRDQMLKSGMKEGLAMSYDKLEDVIAA